MTSETNYDVMEKFGEKLKLLETHETQLPIKKLIDLDLIGKDYAAYADFCIEVVIRIFEDWAEIPVFVINRFTFEIDGKKIMEDIRYNTSSMFAIMMGEVWDKIYEEEEERKKEEEEEKEKNKTECGCLRTENLWELCENCPESDVNKYFSLYFGSVFSDISYPTINWRNGGYEKWNNCMINHHNTTEETPKKPKRIVRRKLKIVKTL